MDRSSSTAVALGRRAAQQWAHITAVERVMGDGATYGYRTVSA
jgi:hypothetical protein